MGRNIGQVGGPNSNWKGSADWWATQKWTQNIGRASEILNRRAATRSATARPAGTEHKAGRLLSGLFGLGVVLLIISGKVTVGAAVLLLVAAAVIWALRKLLFRLLGAAVVLFGLYQVLKHL